MITHAIKNQSGQNIVEFALVAPILFLVIFGTAEFGYAWMQNNTVTCAAREGVRAAAVAASSSGITAAANARAQVILHNGNITGGTVTVTKIPTVVDPNFQIRVTTAYTPIVGSYIIKGFTINLSRTESMLYEGPLP